MTVGQLRGVYVPLITPFEPSGDVALDAIERLVHEYLDAGAAGIVALGTTGESSALDAAEKRAVIDACARMCAEHDAQLIVGAGTNNTASDHASQIKLCIARIRTWRDSESRIRTARISGPVASSKGSKPV